MKTARWVVGLALVGMVAANADDVVIQSFDVMGQMSFTEISNTPGYQVIWATNLPAGGWSTASPPGVAWIPSIGHGTLTVTAGLLNVDCFYQVVAKLAVPGSLQFASATYSVGEGGGVVTVSVVRVGGSNRTASVSYATSNGTATAGSDFTAVASTLNWADNDAAAKAFTVPITDDAIYESNETFSVRLSGAAGASLGSVTSATVTIVENETSPQNMVLIPAGSFRMGACTNVGQEYVLSHEVPQHTVFVSAVYMDEFEVTKALWDEVKAYNGGNGYSYSNGGSGKAMSHPVQTVDWYDAVKWCNARSEKEGLTPVYYTDAGFTAIYKTGVAVPYVKWTANGYRLPTEAEWEKAARGGVPDHRFPWSDADTIQHARANYRSRTNEVYDTSSTRGYHPAYTNVPMPYTSPAGSFAPNGYGLYDMAGNVWEWCWDWYGSSYYASSPGSDPRGPSSGTYRIMRGGPWSQYARYQRCADRYYYEPLGRFIDLGFRCVRGL